MSDNRWSAGKKHNPENDNRILDGVPGHYTVYQKDSYFYADANYPSGTGVKQTTALAAIQNALDTLVSHGTVVCKGNLPLTNTIVFDFDAKAHYGLNLIFDTLTINHNNTGIDLGANAGRIRVSGNTIVCQADYTGKAVSLSQAQTNSVDVRYIFHTGTKQAGSAALYFGIGAINNNVKVGRTYNFDYGVLLENTATHNDVTVGQIYSSNFGLKLLGSTNPLVSNEIAIRLIDTAATGGVYLHANTANISGNTLRLGRVVSSGNYGVHLKSEAGFGNFSNYIFINAIPSFTSQAIRLENAGISGNNQIVGPAAMSIAAKTGIWNNNANNEILIGINCSDITTGKAVENSGKLTCIGTQWDLSKITDTGTIFYVNHWDAIKGKSVSSLHQILEHHTVADTLTTTESGSVHTNLGAGANVKLTLPQTALAGCQFEFVVMTAAQQLQVDPGAAGAIYINGAKQADDAYIWADDEGESVKLVADGNGDWIALYTQGTWTVV